MKPASQKPEDDAARVVTLETVPASVQTLAENDNGDPHNELNEAAPAPYVVPDTRQERVSDDRSGAIEQDSQYKEVWLVFKGGLITVTFYVIGRLLGDLFAAMPSWKKFVLWFSQLDVSSAIKFLQDVGQTIAKLTILFV